MLIRIISDVHGNMPALSAVLDYPAGRDADMTVCAGDVVGYGAEPSACIEAVREACDLVVRGNHDAGAAGLLEPGHFNAPGAAAILWTRGVLTGEEKDWLSSLPMEAAADSLFLCHGDPVDPGGWGYIMSPAQAAAACESRPGKVCVVGHTHLACAWTREGRFTERPSGLLETWRLLNCGSAGQPRDRNPDAACMLVDTRTGEWRHVRVGYDIDTAASRIRDAGLPRVLAERLYRGF